MAIAISIALSDTSRQLIERWRDSPRRVVAAIDRGVKQALIETETYIKVNMLSGPAGSGASGQTPVGLRTGDLREDLTHEQTSPTSGIVGTTERTKNYAGAILGPHATTIRPVKSKHLWVPVADNLGPSKTTRLTPREAMSIRTASGRRALRIFKSGQGNLVAFLPGKLDQEGEFVPGGRYKRGPRKGQQKGRLLFVLKDEVTVQGTDALAKGAEAMRPRIQQILDQAISEALS